jgi:hypothetical protein
MHVWSFDFGISDSKENARERTDGLYVSHLESIHVEVLVQRFSINTVSVLFVEIKKELPPRLDIFALPSCGKSPTVQSYAQLVDKYY